MAYPTGVSFKPTGATIGIQPIHETSATQMHGLGTIVRAKDLVYGEGEFIYLVGVASTAQGDVVTYNSKTGATIRAVAAGTGSQGPVAVACSPCTAGLYGWYQISGSAPWFAATASADADVYLSATAGKVDDLVNVADKVDGAAFKAATSGDYATVQFNRPAVSKESVDAAVSTLQTDLDTAEAAATALDGRVNTIEGAVLYTTLSAAAEAGNAIVVSGQVKTIDGTNFPSAAEVLVRTLAVTADKGDISVTVGTSRKIVNPASGENVCWLTTTGAGAWAVSVANDAAEITLISATPASAGDTVEGLTSSLSLDFAAV